MALPSLTEDGELPLGVHAASLHEVLNQFGVGSAQRKALTLRLARVYRVAQATGHLARFVYLGRSSPTSWNHRTWTCSW